MRCKERIVAFSLDCSVLIKVVMPLRATVRRSFRLAFQNARNLLRRRFLENNYPASVVEKYLKQPTQQILRSRRRASNQNQNTPAICILQVLVKRLGW